MFIMPIGLANIGWKMYMVNASWDIVIVAIIVSIRCPLFSSPIMLTFIQAVYWVETKGRTLEEIDAIFEGQKHSSVPDVELVRTGKEKLDPGLVEHELQAEIISTKVE